MLYVVLPLPSSNEDACNNDSAVRSRVEENKERKGCGGSPVEVSSGAT